MNDMRLPDSRPPRHSMGTTRASFHPELIHGELAVRPRIHSAAEDTPAASRLGRRLSALCMLVVIGVAAHSTVTGQQHEAKAQAPQVQERALSPVCLQWHQAASRVVARLAESMRDADLRQINDAVFRIRRARRNCEAGWLTLACQDYHAVAQALPGRTRLHDDALFACQRWAAASSSTTQR